MKSLATILFLFLFLVGSLAQTRNVIVNTSSVVVQPTNFWSADASNARSGLGLGSAATNPASAFQPSSTILSNLASSNGGDLTNIQSSNIVGVVSVLNGGTGATNAETARTNLGLNTASTNPESAFQPSSSVLSNLASSNGINITNIQSSNIIGVISLSNIPSVSFSNAIQSFVSDTSSATNLVSSSANITVYSISPTVNFITNTVQLPTNGSVAGDIAKVIHTGPTSSLTRIRKIGETTNLITLNQANESVDFIYNGTNWLVSPNSSQAFPIYFSGTNATLNAAISRTNLGLGATWLTNTNVTNFRTAIGLGSGNAVSFSTVAAQEIYDSVGNKVIDLENFFLGVGTTASLEWATNQVQVNVPILFNGTNVASTTRTNLGLGWPALTNTNAGTGLVSVNTNGSVVSPTNFWQQAPIQTIVQTFAPVTNSTNAGTNARNLYVYSLATNISGVTNVVTLPTNANTFVGDNATVIHRGTTSSVTAIRQAGQSTNLIVISNYDDAIKFIHENGSWDFYHNISFVEPIKFTDGNLEFNKATSRTNLGLPLAALTNTSNVTFQEAVFTTNSAPTNTANTNGVNFNTAIAWMEINIVTNSVTNSYRIPLFK